MLYCRSQVNESNFAAALQKVISGTDTRSNTIDDGQSSCTYGELPELLNYTEPIDASACVAVECGNSLGSVVQLLALLRNGNSFVLTPTGASGSDLKPTPHFCSHRILGERAQPEPNADYNGKIPKSGRMYLRTSGSMGASKIVVHSHERLLGNARNCIDKYKFSPASRVTIPVPIAHMYGFGAEFLPAILTGASIDLQEKTNVLKYLDREKRFQPTIAFVTPAICEMLLTGYKKARNCYEVMVTSGQRIGEDRFRMLDPLVGGRLVNQYGSTEMGAVAACDPGDDLDRKASTIGKPMGGVELRVENAGGELYCRHPYGFMGYVDENGDWLQQVEAGDWYRTGDLAAHGADGSITVSGRADASINRSGYLVLLADIERTMEKMEAVGEIAVVAGTSEGKQGQRIAAFCVARSGMLLDGVKLRQRCFEVLPHYAIPDEVRVIDKLPALPSGKVDRQTLTELVG